MNGCTFFHKLNTTGPTAYSTVAHKNFHSLSDILHHYPRFYIFPHQQDYYNNKKTFGHTWSEWAKKIGEVLGEAFESGVLYHGSFIMPGMEDNLSAQTLFMNPLNPGFVLFSPLDMCHRLPTGRPHLQPDGPFGRCDSAGLFG